MYKPFKTTEADKEMSTILFRMDIVKMAIGLI